jgi:dimethylargininase
MFYDFSNAIVRQPGISVVEGLSNLGLKPDYNEVLLEHSNYIDQLIELGVSVSILKVENQFPDAIFVEDPALTFVNGAILLPLGAPTRKGEQDLLRGTLDDNFDIVLELLEGNAEGGDVLRLADELLIGLSERTNIAGASELQKLLSRLGYKSRVVDTPEGVLHFKSDCSALDEETILSTPRLANSDIFKENKVILTPENEYGAANSLRVNKSLLVPSGYPRTAELLARNYDVRIAKVNEVSKIDAGLSCMSLRW